MWRLLLICLLVPCGCLAVIGYEPTPEELEALRRGEDPRAGESERRAQEQQAQQDPNPSHHDHPRAADHPDDGPETGTVLRWVDSATVVIEAAGRRETVALPGEHRRDDPFEEQRVLDSRMERFTYGTNVRLEYPQRSDAGAVIHRDTLGRLVATLHRQ